MFPLNDEFGASWIGSALCPISRRLDVRQLCHPDGTVQNSTDDVGTLVDKCLCCLRGQHGSNQLVDERHRGDGFRVDRPRYDEKHLSCHFIGGMGWAATIPSLSVLVIRAATIPVRYQTSYILAENERDFPERLNPHAWRKTDFRMAVSRQTLGILVADEVAHDNAHAAIDQTVDDRSASAVPGCFRGFPSSTRLRGRARLGVAPHYERSYSPSPMRGH